MADLTASHARTRLGGAALAPAAAARGGARRRVAGDGQTNAPGH
jgi:hypothetical protein